MEKKEKDKLIGTGIVAGIFGTGVSSGVIVEVRKNEAKPEHEQIPPVFAGVSGAWFGFLVVFGVLFAMATLYPIVKGIANRLKGNK